MKRKIIYLLIIAVSTYFAWIFIKSETSQPTIGGNFNLVNQFEEQVSLDDFKDNYLLIYFGYTFCP
ncbi:MAG: SCO family protein, partial [Pseudomonadota bacterium]|nr:SCO family protein [Pseudomonadota bacterium]